jgi:GPH family glycoside/pentoside/hexuronide:cation symporter
MTVKMNSVVTDMQTSAIEGECETTQRHPWWILAAYGGPAMPLALAEVPILLYLPAFYASEVGLATGLVGLVFLAGRIWDGVSDVLIGWLSDRSRSRFGRRKPWVVIGAPLLMVSTWFLCIPPEGASIAYLAVWAAIFYAADTSVKIPHISWGTELATDYVERSRVTSFRGSFSMLGNLFFVSAPLILLANDAPLSDVLLLISFSTLLLVPLTVMPISLLVRDPQPRLHAPTNLLAGTAHLAKDRVFINFSLATLCFAMSNGVINSLAVFSFGVGLQLPSNLFWIIFILYASTICAVPVTLFLAKRIEKHLLLGGGLLISAIVFAAHATIPPGNFSLVAALWIVGGLGNAAWFVVPTSMLADIIDRGEIVAGQRRSGAYVAIYNLTLKVGMAMGVGLSFGVLDLTGFEPAATQHSAEDARNVRLLGFVLPGLLLLPAVLLILKHPITKEVQQRLRAKINASHGSWTQQ